MKKWKSKLAVVLGLVGVGLVAYRFGGSRNTWCKSIAIIGEADGPTAIYIAARTGNSYWIGIAVVGVILILVVILILRKKRK